MEFIDDHPVVAHRVRFRGRADITDDQANLVRDNNTMVWLVRARCLPPQYHPISADGDERYRFNIQDIEGAIPLDGAHPGPRLWITAPPRLSQPRRSQPPDSI
jgi:hypothetical protein